MDNNQKSIRPVLSLANKSKPKKKESEEKKKEQSKENRRRNPGESHYVQTLRNALKEVIGKFIEPGQG